MSDPLRIFIGYDSKEPVAFHVLAHSILRRATGPVAILPLVQSALRARGLYERERGPTEATEFSMTRFLVPFLCGYQGRAVFMDCDMVARVDLWSLMVDPYVSVSVCQHDYTPAENIKMDGQTQTSYPRKNWSSFMVFNNSECRRLTPDYINVATGLDLHRFNWLNDSQIGSLPLEWNWLVGEYKANPDAKVLHYTNGGPWFRDYTNCDHAAEWYAEYLHMTQPQIATTTAATTRVMGGTRREFVGA